MANSVLFIQLLFAIFTSNLNKPNDILGTWISKEKDVKIEVFEKNDKFYGKVVWFECYGKGKPMAEYRDTKNPNKELRSRSWLNMVVLENLQFNKDGYWSGGKIYDPNSGHTFSSLIKSTGTNSIIVRGFLGFELFGQSLEFVKVKN